MTRLKRAARGLAAGFLALLVVSGFPALAHASVGFITIVSVGSPKNDVGMLTIQAQAPTPITGITAYLGNTHGQQVLTTSAFTLTSGTVTDGTWTLSSPLTQQQIPLGSYGVKLSVTDAGNDLYTSGYMWSLGFLIEPTITFGASQTVIDYDHQSVTFSGKVTGLWPDGTVQPLGGRALTLIGAGTPWLYPATAADGTYQATVNPVPGLQYEVTLASQPTVDSAITPVIVITARAYPVKLTVTKSTPHVTLGQKVLITGTVSYEPGTQWLPFANSTVQVYNQAPPLTAYNPVATATVAANGTFSVQAPAQLAGMLTENLLVYAGGLPGDPILRPLLSQAEVSVPVSVTLPVGIALYPGVVTRLKNPKLTVQGCLYVITQPAHVPVPLRIERSTGPTGPWKLTGTIKKLTGAVCFGPGEVFTATVKIPKGKAYYRVHFTGNATFLPGVSNLIWS